MTEFTPDTAAFLAAHDWLGGTARAIAGDLSNRRYTRLEKAGARAILMEGSDASARNAFVALSRWINTIGLSAPRVFAEDTTHNLLLLEDFGDAQLTSLIQASPGDAGMYYKTAVQALLRIRAETPLALEAPDVATLIEATRLIDDWYPGADGVLLDDIRSVLAEQLSHLFAAPRTVSLRDFHTDNIIWLADRENTARLGLLDFQDAFLMHPAYDLMSLITDARIDVSRERRDALIRAFAAQSDQSVEEVARAVAILGVQRNLRILGIFCRSARRDGKSHHLPALPRVRRYLHDCLSHEVFNELSDHLERAVPALNEAMV